MAGRNYEAEKQRIIQQMLDKGASKYEAEQISNEQINAAKQGPSAFEQVQEDEGAKSAQNEAMSRYKERVENGGFTAADSAAQNQASKQVAQQDNSRRLAIMQEMQARGTSGGGNELAQRLAAADGASAQNSDASQQIAARGEQNRTAAIEGQAQLASNMRNQTAASQNQLAQGRDSVNRFNADLTGRATFANQGAANQAAQYGATAQGDFDQRATDIQYNGVVDAQNLEEQKKAAKAKKKAGMGAAVGGVVGGVAGAYFGGPAGAAAGSQAGSAIGSNFAHGGKVPGAATVPGDSPANDTVPAMVSPGEVVVPRSLAKDPQKAAEFVEQVNGEEEEPSIEETILTIAKALSSLKGR